jgi:hypothetical protein
MILRRIVPPYSVADFTERGGKAPERAEEAFLAQGPGVNVVELLLGRNKNGAVSRAIFSNSVPLTRHCDEAT